MSKVHDDQHDDLIREALCCFFFAKTLQLAMLLDEVIARHQNDQSLNNQVHKESIIVEALDKQMEQVH
jgi:hypothetical protein